VVDGLVVDGLRRIAVHDPQRNLPQYHVARCYAPYTHYTRVHGPFLRAVITSVQHRCHFRHSCSRTVFTGAGPHYP